MQSVHTGGAKNEPVAAVCQKCAFIFLL